jgi:hypothetical protein
MSKSGGSNDVGSTSPCWVNEYPVCEASRGAADEALTGPTGIVAPTADGGAIVLGPGTGMTEGVETGMLMADIY